MKRLLLCTALLMISLAGYSQTCGCMDPKAKNYNSSATVNDGSCEYSPTSYNLSLQTPLSDTIRESSGLIQFDNQFWTFNDSGNPNKIYRFNPSNGKILREVTISNATNVDWEAMAQSDDYLFIADFGNNVNGARQDLKIYKISKNDIRNSENNTVTAEVISYTYPDQTSITPIAANTTNFDAEAMVYANDSLHIFSKDWTDLNTRHYILPASAGTYQARLVETMFVDMLVTDASYAPETGNLVLLGYRNMGTSGLPSYSSFCWLLFDYHYNLFFSGNKRRLDFGSSLVVGQTEGISLQSDNKGYITSEKIQVSFLTIPAKLQTFDFSSYFYKNERSHLKQKPH